MSLALVILPTGTASDITGRDAMLRRHWIDDKINISGVVYSCKYNKKRSTAGLRPDPLEVQTLIQTSYMHVAAKRPWQGTPDS